MSPTLHPYQEVKLTMVSAVTQQKLMELPMGLWVKLETGYCVHLCHTEASVVIRCLNFCTSHHPLPAVNNVISHTVNSVSPA